MFYDRRAKPKAIHGQWVWVCKKCETPINHVSADFIGDKEYYCFACDCWSRKKLIEDTLKKYHEVWEKLAKK